MTLPLISVLFVTYNRLVTLRPTLEHFLANTNYPRDRLELIVCDDCSPEAVQAELHSMPFDQYCLATARNGLGANVNQGLRAASGDLILQLQDDWRCLGPPDYLHRAVAALQADSDVGMVILNQHPNPLPVRNRRAFDGGVLRIFENRPEIHVNMVGEHAYTDWPHLKRRSFHDQLGLYREAVPMWEMELDFSQRANAQIATFIADIVGMDSFSHIGFDYSYNTGAWRARLAKVISTTTCGSAIMKSYIWLKRRINSAN